MSRNHKTYEEAIEELSLMLMYLTESERTKAQELLEEYGLADKKLNERFEFRNILSEEAEQAGAIEQICF